MIFLSIHIISIIGEEYELSVKCCAGILADKSFGLLSGAASVRGEAVERSAQTDVKVEATVKGQGSRANGKPWSSLNVKGSKLLQANHRSMGDGKGERFVIRLWIKLQMM